MISFKPIELKDFIKSYSPTIPTQDQTQALHSAIQALLREAPKHHKEKFQEQEIGDFLKSLFSYHIRSRDNIDLAVLVEDEVNVIIEIKAQSNQKEFITSPTFPLAKALSEAIFYFLKERHNSNNSLKHIIICTFSQYYIYDAQDFRQFQEDKKIKKLFTSYKDKTATDPKTQAFYDDLQEYLKSSEFVGTLPYTHFSLHPNLSTEELSLIYQLLSPQVLLKSRKTLDANTLNKGFYEELLYILGLKEMSESGKSGGKIIITPSHTPNSLSDAIVQAYELDEESTFTLITTWNNRILFLALLESMLLGFKHISKPFLQHSIISDFATLQSLFFEVLAKKTHNRSTSLISEFASIPYLNSSLFDRIALEREGKSIGGLASLPLQLSPRSILRKDPRFKDKEALPLLEYLFEFLHAYDFTTTPKDISHGVKQNHDRLINSAVLGLVFEKLNGYKEGSFYTPSFITSYMCKQSITQALTDKCNATYGWEASSLKDIISYARSDKIPHSSLLSTLLSLRICDPAVGSGHFLVSALNEMVSLCYELGLLTSLPLSSTLELENDEILIKTHNELFTYTRPSSLQEPAHQIQVELFNLKKSIIENCLFGVDINPNSCEITKLRLWIELLKYSYYLFDESGANTNALETLPNIDINIKCGNSLISYFGIDENFSHIKNIKEQIANYKHLVKCYKEGIYESKNKIDEQISKLIQSFKTFCFAQKYANEIKAFSNLCEKYSQSYGDYLANEDIELSKYVRAGLFVPDFDESEAKSKFQVLKDAYRKIFSLEENKPFEWRFAFPEVLDEEGNFLGFDAIIGNPPYIRQELIKDLKPTLAKKYEIYKGTSDIYTYFFERGFHIARGGGILSFITSNKWTRAGYGEALRKFILEKTTLQSYIDFNGEQVFESATVDTSITTFLKLPPTPSHQVAYLSCVDSSTLSSSKPDSIPQSSLSTQTLTFSSSSVMALKEKIESIGTPLKEWDITINYGIKTGYNEAFIISSEKREEILRNCKTQEEKEATEQIIKKMLRGRDIKRYSYEWADLWIIAIEFGSHQYLQEKYPSIYSHLLQYQDRLKARGQCTNKPITDKKPYLGQHHWLELDNNPAREYFENFEKIKIVYPTIMASEARFVFDTHSFLCDTTGNIITHHCALTLKYIFAIQSSSFWYSIMKNFYMGGGINNEFKINNILKFPIPKITESNQSIADKIIALVERILEQKEQNPSSSTQELESQIDSLVYTLYNLTDEEIKIIEEGR